MTHTLLQSFKTKIFAGIAALIPLYLTFILLKFLLDILSQISLPMLKKFSLDQIPGLGILLTLVLIYFIGVIVTNFLGKKIFSLGEKILKRVPFVSTIYSTLKQITETFTGKASDAFQGAVIFSIREKTFGQWLSFLGNQIQKMEKRIFIYLFLQRRIQLLVFF